MESLRKNIQIMVDMFKNNYCGEYLMPESFESWCEEGKLFNTKKEKEIYKELLEPTENLLNTIHKIIEKNKNDFN